MKKDKQVQDGDREADNLERDGEKIRREAYTERRTGTGSLERDREKILWSSKQVREGDREAGTAKEIEKHI